MRRLQLSLLQATKLRLPFAGLSSSLSLLRKLHGADLRRTEQEQNTLRSSSSWRTGAVPVHERVCIVCIGCLAVHEVDC